MFYPITLMGWGIYSYNSKMEKLKEIINYLLEPETAVFKVCAVGFLLTALMVIKKGEIAHGFVFLALSYMFWYYGF